MRCDHVHSRIKTRLHDIDRNQDWLSQQTGISTTSISKWMQGRGRPSLRNVELVAQALNVAPGWLAYGVADE